MADKPQEPTKAVNSQDIWKYLNLITIARNNETMKKLSALEFAYKEPKTKTPEHRLKGGGFQNTSNTEERASISHDDIKYL